MIEYMRSKKALQEEVEFYKDQAQHLRTLWHEEKQKRFEAEKTVEALRQDNIIYFEKTHKKSH
jgi:hypothetical protein